MERPVKERRSFLSRLTRKLAKIFAWTTGISLGTLVLVLGLVLMALAIIVQTDTFQAALRDRLVQVARDQLSVDMHFEKADIKIFRLEPRVDFINVDISHRETKVAIKAGRVSAGISVFVSIPLLFFRQLYVSFLEVDGLVYEMKSLRPMMRFFEKVRPKSSVIPPAFSLQTTVREIRLQNMELDLRFRENDPLPKALKAKIRIDQLIASLEARDLIVNGHIAMQEATYGEMGPYAGDLFLTELSYRNGRMSAEQIEFQHEGDALAIRGDIRRWENPILDLRVSVRADPSKYIQNSPVRGLMTGDASFFGPWDRLEGSGALTFTDFLFHQHPLKSLQTQWILKDEVVDLQKMEWLDRTGGGNGGGKISLNQKLDSQLRLNFKDGDFGLYLGMASEDLSRWRGRTTGHLDFTGNIFTVDGKANAEIELGDLEIRTHATDRQVLKVPYLKVNAAAEFKERASVGKFTASIDTRNSQWKGGASWNDQEWEMSWDSDFNAEKFGQLFERDLGLQGKMMGSYKGPYSQIVMNVEQDLKVLTYGAQSFHNLKGVLRLKNRVLSAEPFKADEIYMKGGIYIPKGKPDEFSKFRVRVKNINLDNVQKFVGIPSKVSGFLNLDGQFSGVLEKPSGSGRLEIQDWALTGDRTKGRSLQTDFALSRNEIYFDDLRARPSALSEPVLGSATFENLLLTDLSLGGHRIALGQWLAAFGYSVPFQSMADFDLEYQRSSQSINFKAKAFETSLFGNMQPNSEFQMDWRRDAISLKGQLFGEGIQFEGHSKLDRSNLKTALNMKVNKLNLAGLIIRRAKVEIPLEGEGELRLSQRAHPGDLFKTILNEPQFIEGYVAIQRASINRGATKLQNVDPFRISYKKTGAPHGVISFDKIRIRSERHLLEILGSYRNPEDFVFDLDGTIDVRSVSSFFEDLSRSEGFLTFDGQWRPSGFTGRIVLEDGLLTFQDSPILLHNVGATIRSSGKELQLESLRGDFREGSVSANGRLRYTERGIESADIQAQLDETLLQPQEGLSAVASGPIHLSVRGHEGTIKGDLRIREGLFRRRMDVRADLVRLFETKKERIRRVDQNESMWKNYRLDIRLVSEEPFTIRNNVAEGQVNLNLNVIGVVKEPRLRGTIGIIRGQFNYGGRAYTIRSGSVSFNDPQSNLPTYDIRAETEVDIYRIDVRVSGAPDVQKINYSSDPPLNEKEILNLISFGTPPQSEVASAGDPRSSAAYAGISFVTGQLQDRIEGKLSTDLGINRFQLSPAFYEDTGQTELQLGVGADVIRNKVGVNYYNFLTVSGGHKVELDVRMTRYFSLIGSWRDVDGDNEDDFGADLRFRFEFE